jgi:hypothetical protein
MPSPYEDNAHKEIQAWKNPTLGWFGKGMQIANWPLNKVGDYVMKAPGVGWVIVKSLTGLVGLTNDAAQWSVRPHAIYEEYRKSGHSHISCAADLMSLDLEHVDRTIGWLGAKYKGLALTEGAIAGVSGLPGIPADLIALIALNLRAIGEHATYCGFDMALPQERLFAMHILGYASSPTDTSKTLAMSSLTKIAQDVARKKTWDELQNHALVQVIQQVAKAVGIRLTKAKLAQAIPVVGATVGGSFNAYFTAKVCDSAYFLYRERFLANKYGSGWIDGSNAPPAGDDLDPHYPEEDEELPSDSAPPPGV